MAVATRTRNSWYSAADVHRVNNLVGTDTRHPWDRDGNRASPDSVSCYWGQHIEPEVELGSATGRARAAKGDVGIPDIPAVVVRQPNRFTTLNVLHRNVVKTTTARAGKVMM